MNKNRIKILDWVFTILIPISVVVIVLGILRLFKNDPFLTLIVISPMIIGMLGYIWLTMKIYEISTASLRNSGSVK